MELIRGHFTGQNPSPLLPSQQKRVERFNYIYNLMMSHRQDKFIVKQVMAQFKISKSQAYIDLQDTRYVHGSFLTVDKGFELYKQLQDIERAISWAIERKSNAELIKAIGEKTKILELVPDKDSIPWEKLAPSNYYMLIQFKDGSMQELNLRTLHQLPADDYQKIMEQLNNHAHDTTFEIMENYANGEGDKTAKF